MESEKEESLNALYQHTIECAECIKVLHDNMFYNKPKKNLCLTHLKLVTAVITAQPTENERSVAGDSTNYMQAGEPYFGKLEHIRNYLNLYGFSGEFKDEFHRLFNNTEARGLELHAQQQQGGWISVEDRLPEEPRFVLVSLSGSGFTEIAAFKDDKFCRYTDSEGWNREITISYWQPLPEPPIVLQEQK